MRSPRIIIFTLSITAVLLACAVQWTQVAVDAKAECLMIAYVIIFIGCICSWLSFPDGWSWKRQFMVILLISIAARLLLTGMPVSDDVYRYLWEGKIILAGESPYVNPAEHDDFKGLRDDYWAKMNHKDKLTAYPPLAELIFAGVSYLFYHPMAFKLFFIGFDIATLCVLFFFIRYKGLHPRSSLLYALNPLTLYGFAGEAHFDALLLFSLVLSLFCVEKKQFVWAWIWLGIAIQVKVVAVILLPLYLLRCDWRKSWIIVFPLIIPSLYFAGSLQGLFEGLMGFGGSNSFNGPVHTTLYMISGDMQFASRAVMILFGSILLWTLWAVKLPLRATYVLLGSLVILSPVVHYWYILWVIPLAALCPGLSWLVLSLTSGIYFVSTWNVEHGLEWSLPVWAMWVQWLPFAIILLYELRILLVRGFRPWKLWNEPKTLSVVIPTLNEGEKIGTCLDALLASEHPPDEIIVCDGGSTDNTVHEAKDKGCRILSTARGRGVQIKAGVDAATADLILVLHADCVCGEGVIGRIFNMMKQNPDVVGGAVGQRFSHQSMPLIFIEMLNDSRATLGGCSFGDQGQFFRLRAVRDWGGFPDFPLMEDVEQGLRMMKNGHVVLLGEKVVSSARQWNKESFIRRILLILRLVITYRLSRLSGRDVTEKLYSIYYGKR